MGLMTEASRTSPNSSEPNISLDDLSDDQVVVFYLDNTPVRGRAVRVGAMLDRALKGVNDSDRYPDLIARLLGEAMMLAALVSTSLKFEGRLIVQCHGTNEGAVSLLMADCTTGGNVRGYARWDAEALRDITLDNRHPGAQALLGGGTFSMTIDQGPDMDQYQGLAAIEGDSLAACAENYFAQSDQVPTAIHLAVGQADEGEGPSWRGGGVMIQKIADDELRGDTANAWDTAQTLLATLTDAELLDPNVGQNRILFRLFNEQGVRVEATRAVDAECRCSRDRLEATLRSFSAADRTDMADADGTIRADCEFCGVTYAFPVSELETA